MRLRAELMPGDIDEDLVTQLMDDLSTVEENNAPADELKAAVARLEAISEEDMTPHLATAVLTNYGDEWVRAALYISQIRPVDDVTRDELVEVLRRAYPDSDFDEPKRQAYMAIFDVNVPLPAASLLIYHPPEYPPESQVGPMLDYYPTPDQIVDWIFDPKDISLLS